MKDLADWWPLRWSGSWCQSPWKLLFASLKFEEFAHWTLFPRLADTMCSLHHKIIHTSCQKDQAVILMSSFHTSQAAVQ